MTPKDIRVVVENGFLMAYQGSRYIAQLPDWVDHNVKWTTYSDPESLETVVIISHPHHPPHKLDRKNMNFKPLR